MDKCNEVKYYDGQRILSFRKIFLFSIGNRSQGKSFYWKQRCIKDFLKHGSQFIYVRRTKTDIDETMKYWFNDIAFKFPGVSYEYKNGQIYLNGRHAGYAVPVSAFYKRKSIPYPKVELIFFDEFLPDDNRYLGGQRDYYYEPKQCKSFYQSVARGDGDVIRENCIFVFVANAISVVNPYFLYFGIDKKWNRNAKYIRGKQWILEISHNESVANAIRSSKFGELMAGTDYDKYSNDNKFMIDNTEFIEQHTIGDDAMYLLTFIYSGKEYGVRLLQRKGIYYVSEQVLKSYNVKFALTTDDHTINTVSILKNRSLPSIKALRQADTIGLVRFETQACKNMFQMMIDVT